MKATAKYCVGSTKQTALCADHKRSARSHQAKSFEMTTSPQTKSPAAGRAFRSFSDADGREDLRREDLRREDLQRKGHRHHRGERR
jgi:hypothetical protein